jgi:penicillin-binding protein 2
MTTFSEQLKGRFAMLGLIVLLVLGALLVRLWSMQVLSGASYAAQADQNRIRQITVDVPRGRILDRNGVPLVTNRAVMEVTGDPTLMNNPKVMDQLSTVIGVSVADIKKKLASYKTERLKPRVLLVDVPMTTVAYLVEHAPEFPGVAVQQAAVRQYPQGSLAAHVLGYTGEISEAQLATEKLPDYVLGDIVGKTGIEAQYDQVLQGVKGFQTLEVDAQGRVKGVVSEGKGVPGKDVVLTIDSGVQATTEQALADAIAEAHRMNFTKADAGAAVVLDVRTGEVLAMASAPTYDPNAFIGGIKPDVWASMTATGSEYPLNNRAIMAAYPPGSTFKAVTGMAALQTGLVQAHSGFVCKGKWTTMGVAWSKWCWDHAGHGAIDFTQGIIESCDSVFYEIGYRLYKAKGEPLQAFAKSMGLGSKTGIDLPGEVPGRVPDAAWKKAYNANYPEAQAWLGGDTVNMAIGQGDLLETPLQIATYYAALGNDGTVMKPHLLKSVLGADGSSVLDVQPQVTHAPGITANNLSVMRNALIGVTSASNGTARAVFAGFPYQVAGKTGTSQVNGKDDYALFACYAPANNPQYAVVVLVEQGGHGGSVAGPAARQILSALFKVKYKPVHAVDVSR